MIPIKDKIVMSLKLIEHNNRLQAQIIRPENSVCKQYLKDLGTQMKLNIINP